MDKLNITSAQYLVWHEGRIAAIKATIDNQELFVPLDPANTHYAEIMRQVEAGTLTIQEATE